MVETRDFVGVHVWLTDQLGRPLGDAEFYFGIEKDDPSLLER